MVKTNLAAMSVDALLKLRDDIGAVLSRRADELKSQLSRLAGNTGGRMGLGKRAPRKSLLAGRKVEPKYRDPKTGMTWASRGAQPVWLREAIKGGKKLDDFLIVKPSNVAVPRQTSAAKKSRRKRK